MTTIVQVDTDRSVAALADATRLALGGDWVHGEHLGNFATHWHPTGWRVVVGRGPDAGYWRVTSPSATKTKRWPEPTEVADLLVGYKAPDVVRS
jgi:hypothetical protein